MIPKHDRPVRLMMRMNEARCEHCPPERVCAWACIQGASMEDILIGAVLEQSQSWALEVPDEPGNEAAHQALWDTFNS